MKVFIIINIITPGVSNVKRYEEVVVDRKSLWNLIYICLYPSGKLESDASPHQETLALIHTMDRIRAQIGLKYPGEV